MTLRKLDSLVVALTLLALAQSSSAAPAIVRDGAMEKVALVSADDPKTWSPAECSVTPSRERTHDGASAWHWHIDVDYFAGEANYPVGWPRISHAFPEGTARDWSDWDFLHMWIYAETSRAALPKEPAGLGLSTPDRAGAYNRPLGELAKDRWVEINVPLSQIPRHADVRQIQFHIAEANYRHGDRVDFYLSDLALARLAEPTLRDLAPENTVIFADATRLPVRFELLGVKPGEHATVVCELHRAGQFAARSSCDAVRGAQRVVFEFARGKLGPGEYEVRATVAGRAAAENSLVRVVESPWP